MQLALLLLTLQAVLLLPQPESHVPAPDEALARPHPHGDDGEGGLGGGVVGLVVGGRVGDGELALEGVADGREVGQGDGVVDGGDLHDAVLPALVAGEGFRLDLD